MHRIMLRLAATAVAVLLGCLALSTAVPSGPATASPLDKRPVKLSAAPVKAKVHRGEQVRIHGHLANGAAARTTDLTDALYLEEETQAGVWVNLASTACEPDHDFDISLSLNVAATVNLRVFAPETDIYASATSSVFALIVI
jgi:hypothetical protein